MVRISVDVGGTFTDLVALDARTGSLTSIKVPSIPACPEGGVFDALRRYLENQEAKEVRMVGHATTIATNALLGQLSLDLPPTGLVTTKGFRDVLEIGRQRRSEVYNLFFERPRMLVPRRLRLEVLERIEANGAVSTPLDETELRELLSRLKHEGVASIAFGFLNSYANSTHEERAKEVAREMRAAPYLITSSGVSNGYREYERLSTAVVNAVLMPIMHRYLTELATGLKGLGVSAPLYVMQSNGGLSAAKISAEYPATVVESGPAAGVMAAAWIGKIAGEENVISFDMGGTTAKAGAVRGGTPEAVSEYEVAGRVHMGRLIKGSGYPIRFPLIDLAECSSGGGTIAWADEGRALRVGPTSAGADPGPACYGKGGTKPTVTDANLTFGRLNPDGLLGGELKLRPELASKALTELGATTGMSAEETAVGIVRIANSMMGKILRIVSVERGVDPRDYVLVAFGGAGPMHACALAGEVGIGRIVVPPSPGMFSALGLLTADFFHDYSHPYLRAAQEADPSEISESLREMEATGTATLNTEGIKREDMVFERQLEMRYVGQSYELAVSIPKEITSQVINSAILGFHARHREAYGFSAESESVEVVNIRMRAIGKLPKPELKTNQLKELPRETGSRRVFFETGEGWVGTPVYPRVSWSGTIDGPAIVEQYDATTVIYPGWVAETDGFGNLRIRKEK